MNKPGKGALIETAGGANFKFSKIAISVNNYTTIGLNPYIDTVNVGIQNNTTPGSNIPNDTSLNNSALSGAVNTAAQAINIIGFNTIQDLLCGVGNTCLTSNGINNATDLATALINQADSSGLSASQINQAANSMLEYSQQAAPVIQNLTSGNSYTNNKSNLTVDGGSFTEIAFGYAKQVNFLSGLSIGANLKAINGRIANTTFAFMSNSDTKDVVKDALDNAKSTWKPGLDIGFLWNMKEKYPSLPMKPRLGLVIRNINSPKFDRPNNIGGTYKLDRQARIGLALSPANFWHLALDMDITKNKTFIDGFDSRQLSFGTEINIINKKAFNIPLRAGISKNLAESDSKSVYSLGTGLNLIYMHFDISAQMSSNKTEIDGTKYPDKFAVAASFGLLF
jgi:hypothetical protein